MAPIPGETKVWQYITLMKQIYLVDCPGTVQPSGNSEVEAVLKGVVRIEQLRQADEYVEEVLRRVKVEYLRKTYGLEAWADATDFLEQLAVKTGKLLKGAEPDTNAVAKLVLHDWQRGRLPYFVPPPGWVPREEMQVAKGGGGGEGRGRKAAEAAAAEAAEGAEGAEAAEGVVGVVGVVGKKQSIKSLRKIGQVHDFAEEDMEGGEEQEDDEGEEEEEEEEEEGEEEDGEEGEEGDESEEEEEEEEEAVVEEVVAKGKGKAKAKAKPVPAAAPPSDAGRKRPRGGGGAASSKGSAAAKPDSGISWSDVFSG